MILSVVVGNPKKGSRTFHIAENLAERVVKATGAERGVTIDLIDYAPVLFEWPNAELSELNEAVRKSDIVIIASPTYKAAYTGLLKAFLDRYANNALAGVTAIPLMTAGSPEHAMAVETTLRPLLVELGASVPTRGMHFLMPDMPRLDEVLDTWTAQNLNRPGIFAPFREIELPS